MTLLDRLGHPGRPRDWLRLRHCREQQRQRQRRVMAPDQSTTGRKTDTADHTVHLIDSARSASSTEEPVSARNMSGASASDVPTSVRAHRLLWLARMSTIASPCALVVDDEWLIRLTLCRALTTIGYRVQGAGSVGDALAALDRPFDLAVVDVRLGDGSGLALARVLRRLSPRARIVMISADSFGCADAATLDIVAWLRKPFELDELLAHASRVKDQQH